MRKNDNFCGFQKVFGVSGGVVGPFADRQLVGAVGGWGGGGY